MLKLFRFALLAAVVAACSATRTQGPTDAASPPASSPAPTATPTSSPELAPTIAGACFPVPHEAADLEAQLPTTVAGRDLATWSVHGELLVRCINGGGDADVDVFRAAAAQDGLDIDGLSVAIGGRSDVTGDPPYFVLAYRLTGHAPAEFPRGIGVDRPETGTWHKVQIGGKDVFVGEPSMIDQTEHARGWPFVWDGASAHYLVVTDDDAWAKEVLTALH